MGCGASADNAESVYASVAQYDDTKGKRDSVESDTPPRGRPELYESEYARRLDTDKTYLTMKSVLAELSVPAVAWDIEGVIVFVNDEAKAVLGYEERVPESFAVDDGDSNTSSLMSPGSALHLPGPMLRSGNVISKVFKLASEDYDELLSTNPMRLDAILHADPNLLMPVMCKVFIVTFNVASQSMSVSGMSIVGRHSQAASTRSEPPYRTESGRGYLRSTTIALYVASFTPCLGRSIVEKIPHLTLNKRKGNSDPPDSAGSNSAVRPASPSSPSSSSASTRFGGSYEEVPKPVPMFVNVSRNFIVQHMSTNALPLFSYAVGQRVDRMLSSSETKSLQDVIEAHILQHSSPTPLQTCATTPNMTSNASPALPVGNGAASSPTGVSPSTANPPAAAAAGGGGAAAANGIDPKTLAKLNGGSPHIQPIAPEKVMPGASATEFRGYWKLKAADDPYSPFDVTVMLVGNCFVLRLLPHRSLVKNPNSFVRVRTASTLISLPDHLATYLDCVRQVPTILCTLSGVMSHVSAASAEIFGLPAEQLVGHNINVLIPYPFAATTERCPHTESMARAENLASVYDAARHVVGRSFATGQVICLKIMLDEVNTASQVFINVSLSLVPDNEITPAQQALKARAVPNHAAHPLRLPQPAVHPGCRESLSSNSVISARISSSSRSPRVASRIRAVKTNK
ncbi:hypothetical protein DIPPA_34620 [Diplonema papillatum]|nr:hypothetical protein DIPPA_34620 [Diplonema papillatum]